MLVESTNIVGANEIADRLGYKTSQQVHQWRLRYESFPKPVLTMKAGLFWEWDKVEQWNQLRIQTKGKMEITQ